MTALITVAPCAFVAGGTLGAIVMAICAAARDLDKETSEQR